MEHFFVQGVLLLFWSLCLLIADFFFCAHHFSFNVLVFTAPVTHQKKGTELLCDRARSCGPAGVNPDPEGRPATGSKSLDAIW